MHERVQFALFVVLGSSAWLAINGVFAQLPLLAKTLPEGYEIASYMSVALQAANLAPIVYLAARRALTSSSSSSNSSQPSASEAAHGTHTAAARLGLLLEEYTIGGVLILGLVGNVALAFVWDRTSTLGDSDHSVALLALTVVAGTVDCMSTVTFWSFAARFPPSMVSALAVGQGLSSWLPSLLALAQSPGVDNRFPARGFYFALAALQFCSLLAFLSLARVARAQAAGAEHNALADDLNAPRWSDPEELPRRPNLPPAGPANGAASPVLRHANAAALSVVQNAVLVSVGPYALLPAADGDNALLWATIVGGFLDPIAAAASDHSVVRGVNRRLLWLLLSILWLSGAAALVTAAAFSPRPPWRESPAVSGVLVLTYALARAALALHKTTVFLDAQTADAEATLRSRKARPLASMRPAEHSVLANHDAADEGERTRLTPSVPESHAHQPLELVGDAHFPDTAADLGSVRGPGPFSAPDATQSCGRGSDDGGAVRWTGAVVQIASCIGSIVMFLLVSVGHVFRE